MKNLLELLDKSKKVMVISHVGPDPDAVASTLFTYNMLKENFSDVKVYANIETLDISNFSMFSGLEVISNNSLLDAINSLKPDLLIVVDVDYSNTSLLTLDSDFNLQKYVESIGDSKIKVVVIDHHDNPIDNSVDIYINNHDNSCTETLYKLFVNDLKLSPYKGYVDHVLTGIVADTGFFRYIKGGIESTFSVVSTLFNEGGSIDSVATKLNRLNQVQLEIHRELLKNLNCNSEYTYTYISDEFFIQNPTISKSDYSAASNIFVQYYLKSIDNSFWGFVLRPTEIGKYNLSFRSVMHTIDLREFVSRLNGGGHPSSAGGRISAKNSDEALKIVFDVIESNKEVAYKNGRK